MTSLHSSAAELIREAGKIPKEVIEELSPARRFQFIRIREDILDLIPEKEGQNLKDMGLNERQIEALKKMTNKGESLTNKDYREEFDISRQIATRDLKELEEKGLVSGKGSGPARHYVAKE